MEIIVYYMTTYSTCIACMHVITEQLHKFHHCTCKINNYDRCVQFSTMDRTPPSYIFQAGDCRLDSSGGWVKQCD